MNKFILFFLTFIISFLSAYSQQPESGKLSVNIINKLQEYEPECGRVKIIEDKRIEELLDKHIQNNLQQQGIPGYRIRIFSQSGKDARQNAMEVRAQFSNLYPDVPSYLLFTTPNFKVYVGDFRTRNDALKFYKQIVQSFRYAFIVNDRINYPKLDY